jgi:uracil-DNA glycosylase family 4
MTGTSRAEQVRLLADRVRSCTQCHLSKIRQNAVPGTGNPEATIFMIGQAPGEVEDREGMLFAGPSGVLFDQLLTCAGLQRRDIYLTNLIKCFLPKSRRPSRPELDACCPYLIEEIRMVSPRILVPLGFHPTRFLLRHFNLARPPSREFHSLFGKPLHAKDHLIFPLPDPAFLLFNPQKEPMMCEQYAKLRSFM